MGTVYQRNRWSIWLWSRYVNTYYSSVITILLILGALYTKAVFGEKDRQQAYELISNIRETFDKNLDQIVWIDEQSKSEAKKKLKKMTEKVGYPDFINNRTKLNERLVHIFLFDENQHLLLLMIDIWVIR